MDASHQDLSQLLTRIHALRETLEERQRRHFELTASPAQRLLLGDMLLNELVLIQEMRQELKRLERGISSTVGWWSVAA